ncbi:MAG: single-stranded DNA-binding protein [Chitinophagia bacterium]|jgi:single-strand DNA-binding protein
MLKLNMIGHLGKDCQTNVVNGKTVINFNVAHSERFKDNSGSQRDKTTWVDCAYWTEKAAIAPYLRKGQLVHVEGVPDVRTFTKNDGTPGSALSLRVFGIQLLGSSKTNETSYGEELEAVAEATDDLPF